MSKLLHRSIAPFTSKTCEKHIWIRVLDTNLPAVLLSRKLGSPVDVLVRVPVSKLSSNAKNDTFNVANCKKIEPYKLSWQTMNNAKFFVVPKRDFGLSRKNPAFGHARFKGIFWEPLFFFVSIHLILSLFIDWRRLKEEYGIDILPTWLYTALVQTGIDGDGRVILYKYWLLKYTKWYNTPENVCKLYSIEYA